MKDMKALEGIKVLHLYRTPPSSFAAMFFSDYGADVVVVVEPAIASRLGTAAIWIEMTFGMDRNKRNIALNLKSEEGKDIFLKLATDADVVIDGLKPGATTKLGLDYAALSKINPGIIYTAISGYGLNGPYKDLPGHDLNYAAVAGLLEHTSRLDPADKFLSFVPSADAAAGLYAALGTFIALQARQRTGRGQLVDISYMDSVMSWGAPWLLQARAMTEAQGLPDMMAGGDYPFYDVFQTKDDKYISLSCAEHWFWENLCIRLGCEEFVPSQFDMDKRDEIRDRFREIFGSRTQTEWNSVFMDSDLNVCYSPVNTLDEALTDPQVIHRQMAITVPDSKGKPRTQVGIPIKLSDTPGKVEHADPFFGQHTQEVLGELGISDDEIARLMESQVIA